MSFSLGSLFDGSGTCPLAATMTGITPIWASEIESFPVQVTTKRFEGMEHLGDITLINGAAIAPVDIVTFGSPCQDLSVAGKRAGLDGERSGLFMEAVRIIKEMRGATNGTYPKFALWENVPGAFSSNQCEDFRVVLEELCKIKDDSTSIPRPPQRGGKPRWENAGLILGDGYSIAWRVLDAQFWGVPQRRRRIFLVADFRGQRAGEILFEREGLSRHFAESQSAWKRTSNTAQDCIDAKVYDARGNGTGAIAPTITGDHNDRITDYSAVVCVRERCGCEGGGKGVLIQNDVSGTIATSNDQFIVFSKGTRPHNKSEAPVWKESQCANTLNCNDLGEGRTNELVIAMATQQGNAELSDKICPTVTAAAGMSGNNQPVVCYSLDKASFTQDLINTRLVVRRLMPLECGRLQGFPDDWCSDVPHSDSAEYKMWGNGMALPCVLYVLEGIKKALLSYWLDGLLEVAL